MTQKVRKILIMVVMAALIICLMAASLTYTFTYGRYAGGKFDEESPYGDLIEFVGANQYTVRTPEELIQAIKDGYSNIKIADDAEEPFVIDTGVTDVSANLVLDVNGKTLIRNSRNPMLDVQTNVSVVLIYDSSDEEQGGFYNPVGSALQASGGTLTVGSGNYDDGPKKEEYNEYNGINSNHGTLDTSNSSVTLYARDNAILEDTVGYSVLSAGSRADTKGYGLVNGAQLPKINTRTVPGQNGAQDIVYGNIYLDNGSTLNTNWLPVDTFLLYTEEQGELVIGKLNGDGDVVLSGSDGYDGLSTPEQIFIKNGDEVEALSVACNVASCDFYYYYDTGEWIGADGKRYAPQPGQSPDEGSTPIYAVIYGYWDVKALAKGQYDESKEEYKSFYNSADLVWPYASVRMVEGEGFARGGQFSNNFGTVNSYGIYANGGALTASGANFTTGGDGVCIRCEGSASLSIGGGTFSSEIGNTIEMVGGKMTVTKGTFTKDASVEGAASGEGANNGSAIDIQGGTLTMEGSDAKSFTITGSHVNGVRVEGADDTTATATIENATFNFNEGEGSNSVAGVRSFGGTLTVRKSTFNISNGATSGKTITRAAGLSTQGGTVTATACIFNFAQENATVFPTASAGISSLGGTVTAENCEFTIPGNGNYGIYSSITSGVTGENQYDTKAANCTFKLTGNSNHGIYAAGGKTLASGGTYTIGSENVSGQTANFGIQASSGSVALAGVTLDVYGEKSSCVYAVGGTISLSGENAVNMHFSSDKTTISSTAISTEGGAIEVTGGSTSVSSDALGITAREKGDNEGSISIANGAAVTVGSEKSPLPVTGVYVNGGAIENKGTLTVFSTIDGDLSWNESNIYNGVFVNGGSLDSKGTLNVTFTGVENDAFGDGDNSGLTAQTAYYLFKTKSYAVRVETGGSADTTVTIASGNIRNSVGGGVLVNGGKVTLGREGEGAYTVDENGNSSGLTIETTGYGLENTNLKLVNNDSFDSWIYRCTTTGGDAVKIDGGTLKILGGQYQTAHGNGIFVRGAQAAEEDAYAVEISGGAFRGYNSSEYGENADLTGPAQSYGIKIIGGKVLVNGGTFGSSNVTRTNGSAFFMGLPDEKAEIKIQMGNFYSKNTDAVATFRYTDIIFEDLSDNNKNINISVTADRDRAAVALQDDQLFSQGDRSSTVTINGGTYTANGFGVWYGCSQDNLDIQNGIFTGRNISGLYFNVHPTSNGVDHVTLSGGTYYGNRDERNYLPAGNTVAYANGAIGAPMRDSSIWTIKGGLGNEIQLNQIMPDNAHAGSYSGSSNDKLCDTVSSLDEVTIT